MMDLCYSVKRANYAHERKITASIPKYDVRMTKNSMNKRRTTLIRVTRKRQKERKSRKTKD
jgi:hypothetical protein